MTAHPRRLTGRALLALVVMTGFYLLVIVVAVVLITSPGLEWILYEEVHPQLIAAVLLGLALLRAAAPPRDRFRPTGMRVTRETHPSLWGVVDRVATATREHAPAEIRLTDEMNAFIVDVGGIAGIRRRRVMVLGVPLMKVLDLEELGSVVAHEFGHFRGAGRLGRLINRTRQAMGRTLESPGRFAAGVIFGTYARLYLRLTREVARSHELAADAVAASATSTRATAAALARLPMATVAFEVYLRTEYIPVLASGHQPPFLEGFDAFASSATTRKLLHPDPAVALGVPATAVVDVHPPVDERIRALGVDPADLEVRPAAGSSAVEILGDLDRIEARLVARHAPADAPLVTIPWSEVGRKALVPGWRRQREELLGELPDGFHLGALPLDRDGLAELGADVERRMERPLSRPEREMYAHRAAHAIIGELASAAGLRPEIVPGEPVWFGRAPDQFAMFSAYDDVVEGRAEPSAWGELLDEAGLPGGPNPRPVAPAVVRPPEPYVPIAPSVAAEPEVAAEAKVSVDRDVSPSVEPNVQVEVETPVVPDVPVVVEAPEEPEAPVEPDAPVEVPIPARLPTRVPLSARVAAGAPGPAPAARAEPEPRPEPERVAEPEPEPERVAEPEPHSAPEPVREPAVAVAAPPVAPSTGGVRFEVAVGVRRHQTLVLDADRVTWRDTTLAADEVVHIAYCEAKGLEVRLWTAESDIHIKMHGGSRHAEQSSVAWQALVDWIRTHVEPRLLDAYMERLAERGRIVVGDEVLTHNGYVVRGRVVPWEVIDGLRVEGRSLVIAQRARNLDVSLPLTSVDVTQPDAVLLPALMAAATSAASATS